MLARANNDCRKNRSQNFYYGAVKIATLKKLSRVVGHVLKRISTYLVLCVLEERWCHGIFVHHKLQASQIYFNIPHFEDHVWVNIKLRGSDSLLAGCIYRSPSSNIDTSTISLCSLFADINNYSHLPICGDFNYKEISWSDFSDTTYNCHIEPFLDVVDDLFLFQHITEPTRFRQDDTPSLLDLVFTNEQDMINN